MDQCIKAMGRYYIEKEFGELIDDEPHIGKDQIRSRPNPHVYRYTRKKTLT
jgi:hypothetical protein